MTHLPDSEMLTAPPSRRAVLWALARGYAMVGAGIAVMIIITIIALRITLVRSEAQLRERTQQRMEATVTAIAALRATQGLPALLVPTSRGVASVPATAWQDNPDLHDAPSELWTDIQCDGSDGCTPIIAEQARVPASGGGTLWCVAMISSHGDTLQGTASQNPGDGHWFYFSGASKSDYNGWGCNRVADLVTSPETDVNALPSPVTAALASSSAATPSPSPLPSAVPALSPMAAASPAPLPAQPLPAAAFQISASHTAPDGKDGCGKTTHYAPENVTDGDPSTAWRVTGSGEGESLRLTFAQPVNVTELRLAIGIDKRDPCSNADRWPQGYRPSVVDLTFSDGTSETYQLADVRQMQALTLPTPVTAQWVEITLRQTTLPTASGGNPYTAISEVQVVGSR